VILLLLVLTQYQCVTDRRTLPTAKSHSSTVESMAKEEDLRPRWQTVLTYSESKKFNPPRGFLKIFSKRLRIFKQNFRRLLYVHIYSKLQNFIQLSLNLTKVCHVKCNHPVNFHFSLYRLSATSSQSMNGQTSTHL